MASDMKAKASQKKNCAFFIYQFIYLSIHLIFFTSNASRSKKNLSIDSFMNTWRRGENTQEIFF